MMSTCMGIYLGHVMDGQMINLIANNNKLFKRSEKIVMNLTGCTEMEARNSLEKTEGNLKLAVLLISGAETVSIAKKLINKETKTALSVQVKQNQYTVQSFSLQALLKACGGTPKIVFE